MSQSKKKRTPMHEIVLKIMPGSDIAEFLTEAKERFGLDIKELVINGLSMSCDTFKELAKEDGGKLGYLHEDKNIFEQISYPALDKVEEILKREKESKKD